MASTSFHDRLEALYPALLSDVLDSLGFRSQCLSSSIQALTPSRRVCGKVFTARARAVNSIPREPYKLEMEAIDRMDAGDVLVVDAEAHLGSAFWGELLTTACLAKGVRGVVMSACARDLWRLESMGFPVFGLGRRPSDSLGRMDVTALQEPIELEGVRVQPGDWVLGDADGVVVIPSGVAEEAVRLAEEKRAGENRVRQDLEAGMPVTEAFRKHGIL